MDATEKLNLELHSLTIFHSLLKDEVISALGELLGCPGETPSECVTRYSAFAALLYKHGGSLTDHILELALADENSYAAMRARKEAIPARLEEALNHELGILERIAGLTPESFKSAMNYDGYLAPWETRSVDFAEVYRQRMDNIGKFGSGIYAKYHMFTVKDGGITPVAYPDPVRLADLKCYERERRLVQDNTLALLAGKPAANVLLYGDAGTGKSSTVKALVNEYRGEGLRLIEVRKNQFRGIPEIVEGLSRSPLKFILFIDDLSFTGQNDDFNALKAILEGSVSARTQNVAVYATSNRRHLVRESFSERRGDDVHVNETLQELCSLSERFGLWVGFFRPDRELYLRIVHELRGMYGVRLDGEELDIEAERYALGRNGRSPRVARQFMEYLKSNEL